jgi:hypothetical protein
MKMDTPQQQATGLERQVLGACMIHVVPPEKLHLTPEMFYLPAHQTIFDVILKGSLNGGCDIGTVTQYLRDIGKLEDVGGVIPLTKLTTIVSNEVDILHHAKIIKQKYIARQSEQVLIRATERISSQDDIGDVIDDVKISLDSLMPGDEFAELEKRFRVDFTAEPNPETVILYVREGEKLIRLLSLKNMSMITGHQKARKTFLSILITSSYHGYVNDFFVTNGNGTVLIFDTEQSPDDLLVMMKKLCTMIGDKNPSRIKAYSLKTMTPTEKIKFIDDAIKANPNVMLVVIDGIRDLIYDINAPTETTVLLTQLKKWVAENNIHIINILHLNKNDENPRGHLGTELQNQVELELCVTKDRDGVICTVEPRNMRQKECKPFSFIINNKDLPELCNTPVTETVITKARYPKLMSDDSHFQTLDMVFKNTSKLSTKEFEEAVRYHLDGIGRNTYLLFAQHYKTKGWVKITKGEGKEFRNHYYEYQRMS